MFLFSCAAVTDVNIFTMSLFELFFVLCFPSSKSEVIAVSNDVVLQLVC